MSKINDFSGLEEWGGGMVWCGVVNFARFLYNLCVILHAVPSEKT